METQINGNTYRIGKLDARTQFHVARRLAPLLAGIGKTLNQPKNKDDLFSTFGPLADALSRMSDEDTDYVLDKCLSVTQRAQGNQFAPVMASNGRMMFDDIDLPAMMQLAVAVIRENIGGFFPAAA